MDSLFQQRLEQQDFKRSLKKIEAFGPRRLFLEDRKSLLNFSSNDYLGLSLLGQGADLLSNPSSRLLGGHTRVHHEVESMLSHWLGFEASTLYPTGYMANVGLLSAIGTKDDLILMDKYAHASLIDGARLSAATFMRYKHLDYDHLENLLKKHEASGHCWVVTDSVFSMDGDVSDIEALAQLKSKYGFSLIVDEAHAIGVLGNEGRGLFASKDHLELVDILTFTLSKSFALQGGVVCGSNALKEYLINRSRSFIYTTSTPAGYLLSIPERLEELKLARYKREYLSQCAKKLEDAFGLQREVSVPILPYFCHSSSKASGLANALENEGVYCPAVRPPTVPESSARLRISLTSEHVDEDIQKLVGLLETIDLDTL